MVTTTLQPTQSRVRWAIAAILSTRTAPRVADVGLLIVRFTLAFLFIWLRATAPRLRYDQLMRFGWKVLLPLATVNAVVTAALVVALD